MTAKEVAQWEQAMQTGEPISHVSCWEAGYRSQGQIRAAYQARMARLRAAGLNARGQPLKQKHPRALRTG